MVDNLSRCKRCLMLKEQTLDDLLFGSSIGFTAQ